MFKNLKFILVALSAMVMHAEAQTARVQIIHNSADLAADTVDVWVNGNRALPNFAFRTATPFLSLPAGQLLNIHITAPGAADTGAAVFTKRVTLTANDTFIVVASGIISPSGYSPAPAFDLFIASGREASAVAGQVSVLAFHGASDAPAVDINERSVPVPQLIPNLAFGNFAGYLNLAPANYTLGVAPTGGADLVRFTAPLAGFADSALVVLASGFLNPAQNSNGPAFGLFVAPAQGGTLLPLNATAKVQIIHNAADLAADTVDVWVNGARAVPNFAFRTATPFVDLPSETELTVHITAPGAADTTNAVFRKTLSLDANESYVVVANGIVSPSGYTPATPFDLYVFAQGRVQANDAGEVDVLVFHGSTDAPAVDVNETSVPVPQLVPNLAYGNFAGYLELAPLNYTLGIAPAGGNNIAQFSAPLQTLNLQGVALVVVASGFLDPSQNSNGPAFGLFAASPAGGALLGLPAVASSTRNLPADAFKVFPNPARDAFDVQFTAELEGAQLQLTDMQGRVLRVQTLEKGIGKIRVATNDLAPGLYFGQINKQGQAASFKLLVQP